MSQRESIIVQSGFELKVEKVITDDAVGIILLTEEKKPFLLHWGLRRDSRAPWQAPPPPAWPDGSRGYDHSAIQTPFALQDGRSFISITLSPVADFSLLEFVLFFPGEGRWDNNNGRNYRITLPAGEGQQRADSLGSAEVDRIADEIIDKETTRNSWTLMHRFNLCHDLLDRITGAEGMSLIFVWLRFSFIRQLDWQRNYNTQPRELGHAMDRLTLKLADRYERDPEDRGLIRLVMTTLGRGSDAQRVRDEVLNIMHRHHIKEVSGHFMEEWHQKLHNNTTPDDIVICEAYLEFLRSNGNMDRFYTKLNEEGVTKARLESYERPIKSSPDFIPHLKDALIRDFEHFLGILKGVHTGTDLGTAIYAARYLFDPEMHGIMDFLWSRANDSNTPVSTLIEKITVARRRISKQLTGRPERVRDFLFLDIALEDFLRTTLERMGPNLEENQMVDVIAMVLENLFLSEGDDEVAGCLAQWKKLAQMPRFGREWSLQARAVLDLMGHVLGVFVDRTVGLLQPRAELLGKAFGAAPWAVDLFSEEILRGRPAFALSMLLRYLDPVLRKNVKLGNWQIISRSPAAGKVTVVETLKSIQGRDFSSPVVIVTDNISGNEEIPGGVAAILTPAVIDILSHLAVRARNAGILFATCYDADIIAHIESLRDANVKVSISAAGDVVCEESLDDLKRAAPRRVQLPLSRPAFSSYAVSADEFHKDNVGGKSLNLKRMVNRLPQWVRMPASAAIPFGVFEKVLADEENRETALICEALVGQTEKGEGKTDDKLAELRRTILNLKAPGELVSAFYRIMEKTGLPVPADWDEAWHCIKEVWSSKWNERAYLSRKTYGIPHGDTFMSVLIQRVVEADYSYVIHTENPFTGARDEIYGEAVLGLGEALVGNYPGRAFSFVRRKDGSDPQILTFPSKSSGLSGGGLIFRSDSNGEDLEGYAAAGLYDSFILPEPLKFTPQYVSEPLFWDDTFRRDFMVHLSDIGVLVENILEGPQDIEGAFSGGGYYVVQSRPQVGLEKG